MVAQSPWGSRMRAACLFWLATFIAGAYGDCDPPPLLNNTSSNADPTKDSFEIGSTVTYICDETKGYVQSPGKPNTITCKEDSTWSEIQDFCVRSCKPPPNFLNGQREQDSITRNVFPVGTSVTYTCRPGYVLKRKFPKTVTCLDTLQWTKIEEFCNRMDCGNPGEIINGDIHFEMGADGEIDTKFGSSVTFVCNAGFRTVGRNTRICKANGWNNAVPSCEAVICPKPADLPDGTYTSMGQEEFKYQSGVTYSCNSKAFSLIGEASIYCTKDGDWSGQAPKCKVISCTSPNVPNADRISGYGVSHTFKDTVEFACKAGFVINGSSLIECGEDNQWHPQVPVCQLVTCGSPPQIADGTHNGTGHFDYGTTVTYRCNSEEFMLTGNPSIYCGIHGSWSEQTPKCRVVTCGPPPEVADGTHDSKGPFAYGTSVTYRCNAEKFRLTGEPSIHCGINGSWSGHPPICRAVDVPVPFDCEIQSIPHGQVIPVPESSPENKKTFEVDCNFLYVLHGENRIHCIGEKQWHTSLPECHISPGLVAGCIISVLIVLLVVGGVLYWYSKKKQGHYPTNEKGSSKAETMQLKDSNNTVET